MAKVIETEDIKTSMSIDKAYLRGIKKGFELGLFEDIRTYENVVFSLLKGIDEAKDDLKNG